MTEQHADETPRRDFEQLQKELEDLKEHHQKQCKDFDILKMEHG